MNTYALQNTFTLPKCLPYEGVEVEGSLPRDKLQVVLDPLASSPWQKQSASRNFHRIFMIPLY